MVRLHKHIRQHIRLYLEPDLVSAGVAKAFVDGIPLRTLRLEPIRLPLLCRALGRTLVIVGNLLLAASAFFQQLVRFLLERGGQLIKGLFAIVIGKVHRSLLKMPRHGLLRLLEASKQPLDGRRRYSLLLVCFHIRQPGDCANGANDAVGNLPGRLLERVPLALGLRQFRLLAGILFRFGPERRLDRVGIPLPCLKPFAP